MSTTMRFSDPEKTYKKLFHRRNDSGELDVFEAARYFSGATEVSGCRGGRISLEMPMRTSISSHIQEVESQINTKEKKKPTQPNSPGGRIANFLNSLFNQTSSKKKKSKSTPHSMKDHEAESPDGRRKRRSSISHSASAPIADPNPIFPSTNSGFRTPPPYAITPTKAYKDLRSHSDHKPIALPRVDKSDNEYYSCFEGEFNFQKGFAEKFKDFGDCEKLGIGGIWSGKCQTEKKETRKVDDDDDDDDDGAESDSSSDLFELQNYDLNFYSSSGLPVYETTHLDSIKRAAPISNGAI